MLISVIVPTYKPQSYIWECLDSLTSQTFSKSDFEVIIVLNGCSDPYESEIKNYIDEHIDTNITLFQTNQGGVSNARNIGIDLAMGEYIAFIDDDDYVSPKYLEELYKNVSEHVVALCYPLTFRDGTKNYKPYRITEDYTKNVENDKVVPLIKAKRFLSGPVHKLIHRNIIGDRRFNKDFKLSEDSIFMFLISDAIAGFTFSSTDAVYYRRNRSGSAMTSLPIAFYFENTIKCLKEYTIIFLRGGYSFNLYITRIFGGVNLCLQVIKQRCSKNLHL